MNRGEVRGEMGNKGGLLHFLYFFNLYFKEHLCFRVSPKRFHVPPCLRRDYADG